jgi:hypothetical protein
MMPQGFGFSVSCALTGLLLGLCACSMPVRGVTLNRCRELLGEAREHNRECRRIVKAYESENCQSNPEQAAGGYDFGGAGF